MSERPTVAIIGGGVTGLTTAYRLLQRGCSVRIYEAGDELGGLVRTFQLGDETLECFYHHLFTTDRAAVHLFDELGVGARLEWLPSRVGVFCDGRVYPFTTTLDLLRFSPLGVPDRMRLGLTSLRLRGETDGSKFEGVTAAEWVRKEMGERVLDAVWGPLLRGKFGEMWDQVGMTWLWNKIRTRFSSRGRLSQREVLGYMKGSFGVWTSALAARVRELGAEIQTSTPISRIVSEDGRIRVDTGGQVDSFDAAVATVANGVFEHIAPELPEYYVDKLRGTKSQDALCLVLALDRPLTPYYWLNINDREMPFVAVIEHTNLVDAERYGGRHVVYVSNYVERDAQILRENANEVLGTYAPHLRRINPAFNETWVRDCWLFHARDAQPVFTVGAGSRVPQKRTPVPGLYLANMAQIYPQDRGQNYAIELGEEVAGLVAEELAGSLATRYQV
jgi:protoporphyrinogen oxidase